MACFLILCLLCGLSAPIARADAYGPGGSGARVRFYNGRILIPDGSIVEGELWTEGNRIGHIGAGESEPTGGFDREIDLNGNLIIPGFKNGHAHSPMTFLRSYADDLPLDRWLNEKIYPMEALLTGEDVYAFYALAVMEYLQGGITSAFDMYMYTEEMVRAAVDTGFRAVFCGAVNDFLGSAQELEAQYLALNAYHDRVGFRLGFHAEYTTSETLLLEIAALSEKYAAPVYFHNSETADEVQGCIARHGMTPTEYFLSLGLLNHGGGAYHCVHMTQRDKAILAAQNIGVVTNPASNCKLASGIAPIVDMAAEGIVVGLGTDGPASNNALDMFREMYLAGALQRVSTGDPTALSAGAILQMATENSAAIMGLADCMGLTEGMLADLVVLDLNQPNMKPGNDLLSTVVYAGGKQNVQLTMVDGRILYENGRYYIGIEEEDVYRMVDDCMMRIGRALAGDAMDD